MAEGEFYAGGVQRFQREGGSRQEITVKFPDKNFDEKHQELIANGAAQEIARKYKFGSDVRNLLRTHTLEDITPEVCAEFIKNSPEYQGYHPALVLAVAEAITSADKEQEALETNQH